MGVTRISLASVVGQLLNKSGSSVSTAESCTGGNVAAAITSVPGSSDYFKGSVVSYSNEVKIEQLGVEETDLANEGAVSESVAVQMARGAAERLGTDYTVSTTGIAGPDGGTDEKPVGTVWIGVHTPSFTKAKRVQLFGTRKYVIQRGHYDRDEHVAQSDYEGKRLVNCYLIP